MILKAYRYRIYPTAEQKRVFAQHFGSCRFVYNHFLDVRKKAWDQDKQSISGFACKKMLPALKQQYPWLADINSQSLQAAVLNLESAYRRFFKGVCKYPRFHKKHTRQAFTVPQHFILTDGLLRIPKLQSQIKVRMHRQLEGIPKTLTIIKESSGKHYVSVSCECDDPHKFPLSDSQIGVDLGLKNYAVLSTGEKIEHPKWLRQSEMRLARQQRHLAHKQLGSNNRIKARLQVARLHEKVSNQRQDFLHKLSYRLINENQVVSIEGLRVSNMVRNRHLSKAISDSGWGEFARQLQYKAEWYGRTVKVLDTFYPSSKTCSICGVVNKNLKLSHREWGCLKCGTVHDRDHNAAVNIDIIGRDTPEVTPVERRAAAVSILSMRQVRSTKQEALASQ